MRSFALFALVLVGALALVGTAAANPNTMENLQNGPGSLYYGDVNTFSFVAPLPTLELPDYKGMMYGRSPATSRMGINWLPATGTNTFSFVAPVKLTKHATTPYKFYPSATTYVVAIGIDGSNIGIYDITKYRYKNPTYDTACNAARFDLTRSNGRMLLSINGVSMGDVGAAVEQPYYYSIWNIGGQVSADDYIVGPFTGGSVGVIPQTWTVVKDMADPSMNGLYNENKINVYNTAMYASYNIVGDATTAQISIDGDEQVKTIVPYSYKISSDATNWYDSVSPSGIVAFNLTQFMANKTYGRHTVQLVTSTGTEEAEFWYTGTATAITNIMFDRDIYAPQDSVQINSTIGDAYWQPGTYSYYGALYDRTTGQLKGSNWSITSKTQIHSTAVTTDLFPSTGDYMTMLYAVDSQGREILLDTDTAYVYADKMVFSGTVWNAQQGTVLSGATVSLTQGGTTTTKTTGSDGRFEFVGLNKDVLTQVSAAKTGFVTSWSNTTPTEFKRYEIDIAMAPSAPAHTGTTIFGTVRCYPVGAPVGGATVKILKDGTQINSTTSASKGFYIFDGLQAATTYTIEVDKTGFSHYSNAAVTGSANSLTQLDPLILPQYQLNVTLKDSVTNATITRQMAVSVGGQSYQTTNGTVRFSAVDMGPCSIAVVGDGYDAYETTVTMTGDRSETLFITPSAVPITTTIGLTPTPTPAIVGIGGLVYDGMTGLPITGATVTVTALQAGFTRSDTTDANGNYDIQNIMNNALTTINATATGYKNESFTVTPTGSAEYVFNIVMYRTDEETNPTHPPQAGKAGAGGAVLGGWEHLPIKDYTLTATNGTWTGTATYDNSGEFSVWYYTNLEPNQAYNFTAAKSGYVSHTVQATMGGPNSFTVVKIELGEIYDITIEVKDIDSKSLITGKQVEVTCSNGVKQNTTTGKTTFSNLLYQEYVFTATCEGYQEGGISALAYSSHTEYIYLSKIPSGGSRSIDYSIPPKHVELVARSIFGAPLSGVAVTVQGTTTTLPDPDLLGAIFGWTKDYSDTNLANATMTGTTGPDGAVSFLLTDTVRYLITFSDPARGISQTTELYPHDTQYVYILGAAGMTPAAAMPNMTLWAEDLGATTNLNGYYSDPAGTTTALWFVVESQNGTALTEVSNQSLGAVQTASPSFAVNHTTGDQYVWGFRASTPDRGELEQWSGITLHSRLIDLGIEEFWYFWISAVFLFIFAGLFSGMTAKYGFILLPLFALLLWYIGWLDTSIATLGIAAIAGVLMYISRVQVG